MRDRNGAELKPGDRVKVEWESEIVTGGEHAVYVRHWDFDSKDVRVFVPTKQLTKVVPEFEWTERLDADGNTHADLRQNRPSGTSERVARAWPCLRENAVQWQWTAGGAVKHEPTLEAAKAAALAACRSAAEGGRA